MDYIPYEICNRFVYSSLTEDAWIKRSCVLKIFKVRRKPAMFLVNFRPGQGWLMCFDCINKFLVMCRLILDSLVAWGGRNRVLRPHSDESTAGVCKIANRPPNFWRRWISVPELSRTCKFIIPVYKLFKNQISYLF